MATVMTNDEHHQLQEVFNRLYSFSWFTYGHSFIEGQHLKELSYQLERGLIEQGRRLIVNLPPRHSKTTFCSINYPTWRVFQDPNLHIIIITYGDDLSEEIGTQIRSIIHEYGHFFNVYLSHHTASKTKIKFQDDKGKEYKGKIETLGYKGAITGKTADIIIIDDLIKGPEDALSPAQNKKVVDFYKSAIFTRLFEHSEVILVSTRWSKTDLTGHLLDHSVEDWETYIKPALNDDNESLWPERFTPERMQIIREEQGPFWWSALYLQEPEELKGDVFEGEFVTVTDYNVDDVTHLIRYWDRASTESKDGTNPDWTVGMLMASMKDGTYLVLDVTRFRGTPATNEQKILKTAIKDGTGTLIVIEQEPGSSGKDSVYHYQNHILKDFKSRGHRPTGSKHIRAIDVAASVESGKTKFIKAPWNGALFLELRAFPYGSHDDQVDALSGSYTMLTLKTRPKIRARGLRR